MCFVELEEVGPLMQSQQVKQQTIRFPDKMRGSCLNSEEFQWEQIQTEDQVINLAASHETLSNVTCFAIPKATVNPASNAETLLQ
ncbi:protein telomere ends associated-like isoform X1 [Drosophila subobscura]|uniref:protein telomere ends associated-like isoform X1 n=1 Tax=Drosophila subobscura TaxID=7241 RepID=UPI00155A128E|nr:protein telomere ends associated-like isoform X1 [Drosophila subobscura]